MICACACYYKIQQFVITSTGTNQYLQRWVSSDGSTLGGFFEEADTSGRFFVSNAGGSIGVQLDTGGDSFFAGGNVGIGSAFAGGAASPASLLHIGDATTDTSVDSTTYLKIAKSGTVRMQLNSTNSGVAALHFGDTGDVDIGSAVSLRVKSSKT